MREETIQALQDFVDGWTHFCNCIDFGKSCLDSDAIGWMNEVPGKLQTALKQEKAEKK